MYGSQKGSAGSLQSLAEDKEFIPFEENEGTPVEDQRKTIIGDKLDHNPEDRLGNGGFSKPETSKKLDRYLKEKGVAPIQINKEEVPSKHKIQTSSFASPQAQSIGGAIHRSQVYLIFRVQ